MYIYVIVYICKSVHVYEYIYIHHYFICCTISSDKFEDNYTFVIEII